MPKVQLFGKSSYSHIAMLAKFTLSFMSFHMTPNEIQYLALEEHEAETYINDISVSIKSAKSTVRGFSLLEFLQIFVNLSHPYFTQERVLCTNLMKQKKQQRKSNYEGIMAESASMLEKNLQVMNSQVLLESLICCMQLPSDEIKKEAIHLTWHLLHFKPILERVITGFLELTRQIENIYNVCTLSDELQQISYCALMNLGYIEQGK